MQYLTICLAYDPLMRDFRFSDYVAGLTTDDVL